MILANTGDAASPRAARGGRTTLGDGVVEKSSSSRKSSMTKWSSLAAVGEVGGRRRGSVEAEAVAAADDEDESRARVSRSSAAVEGTDGEGSAAIIAG